ncbi:hypothetical protein ACFV2U_00715 [Streptomyces sp. NPDC059697]|uniref:hypothetical protein n=1 Tax=Streptomyces TaxID=1883 RepID=UPI00340C4662
MNRFARFSLAVASAIAVFGVCLWLFQSADISWMPEAEADHWVVAAAFATVAATAVFTAVAWWAGREAELPAEAVEARVDQKAKASGHGQVTQVGRDQHNKKK